MISTPDIKPLKDTKAERKITITEKRYREEVKKIKNRFQKAQFDQESNPNANSISSSTPSTSGMTSSITGSGSGTCSKQTPGPSGLTKNNDSSNNST